MITTKNKIEVMQHWLDGGDIEIRGGDTLEWEPYGSSEPVWNWEEFEYRKTVHPVELTLTSVGDARFMVAFKNIESADNFKDGMKFKEIV